VRTPLTPLVWLRHWFTQSLSLSLSLSSSLTGAPLTRIQFKTSLPAPLRSAQPAYLQRSSLHSSHSTRSRRLSNTNLLSAPFVRTSFGARSFSVAAPIIWNSLPPSLRTCTSPDTFRRHPFPNRPPNPFNPFLLAPHIRHSLTIVRDYKLLASRVKWGGAILRKSIAINYKSVLNLEPRLST